MARSSKQNIPNAYDAIFSKESNSARRSFEQSVEDLQAEMAKVSQKVDSSKLDNKLKQMLQVQIKNLDSSKASAQIEKFISEYSKEAKLGKRQTKYLQDMKTEIEKLRSLEQKQFQASIKYQSPSFAGAKEAYQRGGVKGALQYGKTAAKSMSAGNMMKAGLHTAGVAFNSPALNLLASSLDPKRDEKSYEVSDEIRNILRDTQDNAKEDKTQRENTSKQTESITSGTDEIVGELKTANKSLSEMLFRQRDMADDYKVSANSMEEIKDVTPKSKKEKEASKSGLLSDLADLSSGKGKGKLSKLLGRGAGMASGVGKFAMRAAPWAMAGGAAYGAYQGASKAGEIFGVKDPTLMNKVAAGLAGIANFASFGAVDTASFAKMLQGGATAISNAGGEAVNWAVDLGKAGIGAVSKYFESGKGGAGTISSGRGDLGGKSYGSHQLSSKTGTLQKFLGSTKYGAQFKGLTPGSEQFDTKWKSLAASDSEFGATQEKFIGATHYAPQAAKLKGVGLDLSKRSKALQSEVYSTGVQFGGATELIKNAMKEAGLDPAKASDKEILNAIFAYKKKYNQQLFRKSSPEVRAGTLRRTGQEQQVVMAALEKEQGSVTASPISPALNTKTEQAVKAKSKAAPLTVNNKQVAPIVVQQSASAPQRKTNHIPLEESNHVESLKLGGVV